MRVWLASAHSWGGGGGGVFIGLAVSLFVPTKKRKPEITSWNKPSVRASGIELAHHCAASSCD